MLTVNAVAIGGGADAVRLNLAASYCASTGLFGDRFWILVCSSAAWAASPGSASVIKIWSAFPYSLAATMALLLSSHTWPSCSRNGT